MKMYQVRDLDGLHMGYFAGTSPNSAIRTMLEAMGRRWTGDPSHYTATETITRSQVEARGSR